MTSNTSFNNNTFLNTLSPFNYGRFELWKARFKIFIQKFSFELWETIINGHFIHTHFVNSEVIDKFDFPWTV